MNSFFQPTQPMNLKINGKEVVIGKKIYYPGELDSQGYTTLKLMPYVGFKGGFIKINTLRFELDVSYTPKVFFRVLLTYDVKQKKYYFSARNKAGKIVRPADTYLKDIYRDLRLKISEQASTLLLRFDTDYYNFTRFKKHIVGNQELI